MFRNGAQISHSYRYAKLTKDDYKEQQYTEIITMF